MGEARSVHERAADCSQQVHDRPACQKDVRIHSDGNGENGRGSFIVEHEVGECPAAADLPHHVTVGEIDEMGGKFAERGESDGRSGIKAVVDRTVGVGHHAYGYIKIRIF